jgi:hypothetical protein
LEGLSFGLGLAFLASALSSLAPLWQAIRTAPNDVLTEGVRVGRRRHPEALPRARRLGDRPRLHAARRERDSDRPSSKPHARRDRVRSGSRADVQLTLSDAVLSSPRRVPYQTRLVEALEAIPSVSRAGFANQIPLDGC